ncbi:MAG TPA: hypothetical protein VMT29_11755, partial [Steroidobacteraceae bacterium]|nr:hypothetical protein [Steroidobacteraceae bacterium]
RSRAHVGSSWDACQSGPGARHLTPGEESRVTPLSEWLQIMLAEIARKRDEQERALQEDTQRRRESDAPPQPETAPQRPNTRTA